MYESKKINRLQTRYLVDKIDLIYIFFLKYYDAFKKILFYLILYYKNKFKYKL